MLGTVLLDTYSQSESAAVAQSIDDLCSPTDQFGWASAGVYVFFDPLQRMTLYIGLAGDLAERFRQHNVLLPCEARCCKSVEIGEYFRTHPRLGYGMLVQSPLSQPTVGRNRAERADYPEDREGYCFAQTAEGSLIESARKYGGGFPPWNKVGGATAGRTVASSGTHLLVQALSGDTNSPLVAKRTIRELTADEEAESYEEHLHAARLGILHMGMEDLDNALAMLERRGAPCPVPRAYIEQQLNLSL